MLYRTRRANALRHIASRLLGPLLRAVAALRKQLADTRHLDGLRPAELEELGLRRAYEREYRTLL
jgi:hypothetical protein